MKIKVRVTDIVQALEKKDAAALVVYEKAMAKFRAEKETFDDRFRDALTRLASDVRAGRQSVAKVYKHLGGDEGRYGILSALNLPTRPTEPRKPGNHKDRIEQLKMATEPFLMLTPAELAECGIGNAKGCVC